MTSTDPDFMKLMAVVTDLQAVTTGLLKRIEALETVIADALPEFNNATIAKYANTKRHKDLNFYQIELFKNSYLVCTPSSNDSYNNYQSVDIILSIGSTVVTANLQIKKPILTF
jgi:hypothetical protein